MIRVNKKQFSEQRARRKLKQFNHCMRPHLCPTYYVYHLVLYLQTSHRSARVKSCAKHATAIHACIHASVPWSPDQSWCPFRASRMKDRGLIFEIHIPPISYPHDCIKGRQVLSVPLRCPQDPQSQSVKRRACFEAPRRFSVRTSVPFPSFPWTRASHGLPSNGRWLS